MRSVKRASLRPLIQTVFCAFPTRKPICLLLNAAPMLSNNRKRPAFVPCDVPTNHHNLYGRVDFAFIGPEYRTVVLQIGPHYIRIYGLWLSANPKQIFIRKQIPKSDRMLKRLQSFKIQMHAS